MKPEKKLLTKLQQMQPKPGVEIPAFLGDLNGVVKADENNNVYVALINGQVEIVKNHAVPNIPRLPVVLGYRENSSTLEVLRLRDVYDNPPYVNVPAHAEKTHGEYGVDPVRVTSGQFLPGLAFPIAGTLTVQFFGCVYYLEGWHILPNQILDFTGEIPLIPGAHFVLVEVDVNGVVSFRAGASKAGRDALVYEDIPLMSATNAALFAVSIYFGQTEIRKTSAYTDIYDLRFSGAASGGLASVVDWAALINVPAEFPPDTDITDLLYPRKWIKNAAPTVNDDTTAGYSKADEWVDATNGKIYFCLDNADGAATWIQASSSVGGGDPVFFCDGGLALVANAPNAYIVTKDLTITEWYIYVKENGSAASTIVDVNKNGVTVFTTQANRPEVAHDDANQWAVSGIADITTFAAGDIITVDIDQVATGAADLVVAGRVDASGGSSDFNLTVEESDGSPSIENVGKIKFENLTITDETGGVVKVTYSPEANLVKIAFDGSPTTSGQNKDRTSGGTYTAHRAYVTIHRPLKLDSVKWDVSSAKTYTLKIYRGWQLVTVFSNLGDQTTVGRTAEVTWDAADIFMPAGHYVFELKWTGAVVVDDNTIDSSVSNPNEFDFFMIERTQYNTTFDDNYSAALKLVVYLGTENLTT